MTSRLMFFFFFLVFGFDIISVNFCEMSTTRLGRGVGEGRMTIRAILCPFLLPGQLPLQWTGLSGSYLQTQITTQI
jgi:hypothetical protein